MRPPTDRIPRRRLQGHLDGVTGLAWDAAGTILVSSSFDGTATSWDPHTGTPLHTVRRPDYWMTGIALSADGSRAVITLPDCALIWDPRAGRDIGRLVGHSHNLWDAAISADGRRVVTVSHDHTVRVWSAETLNELRRLTGHTETVLSAAITRDGRRVVSAGDDETIRVWSLDDGKARAPLVGHSAPVRAVALTGDDSRIVSASMDGTLKVWDLETGDQVATLEGHGDAVGAVSVSADGRIMASASFDGAVILWRCDTWAPLALLPSVCTKFPVGLAFGPGARLATVDAGHDIVLWELDADALLRFDGSGPPSYYTNAKVAIVGESGLGKSCLARALAGLPFMPQESTHGLRVWNLGAAGGRSADGRAVTRETLLWDFAGQPDYHLVHQLFLARTALTVVMFDPTNANDPFGGVDHWRAALHRLVGEGAPAILVAGRVDRGSPTVGDEEIAAYTRAHGFEAFVATSAKTMRGIPELRQLIDRHVRWDTLPVTSSPQLWREIREYLLQQREHADVLVRIGALRQAFRAAHADTPFTDEEFAGVVGHAQAQGLLWRLSFGDLLLLRPELLNSYASAVVRSAREHPLGLGSIAERDVLEGRIGFDGVDRLPVDDERLLLHAVVELVLANELAFREGELLVFPSKHTRGTEQLSSSLRRHTKYRFSGPVESTYATLIVRLAYCGAFSLRTLCRHAAEFRDPGGRSCAVTIEMRPHGWGDFVVSFEDQSAADSTVLFVRFVEEHLRRKATPGSLVRRAVYRCPACHEEITNDKAVEMRRARGFGDIRCQFCDEPVPLNDVVDDSLVDARWFDAVQALDRTVDRERSRAVLTTTARAKNDVEQFDVFLAHNARDKPGVEAIARRLKERGLNPWLDKWSLAPGRRFAEEIERVLPTTRAVAVFIAGGGAGPWEEMEIYAALQLFVRHKRPLIPVLLPGAHDSGALPLFLQQFSVVRFETGIDDEEALDRLEWGITGQQPKRGGDTPGMVAREERPPGFA